LAVDPTTAKINLIRYETLTWTEKRSVVMWPKTKTHIIKNKLKQSPVSSKSTPGLRSVKTMEERICERKDLWRAFKHHWKIKGQRWIYTVKLHRFQTNGPNG